MLLAAMPAGATTSMLAAKYDRDPEFATKACGIFNAVLHPGNYDLEQCAGVMNEMEPSDAGDCGERFFFQFSRC